VENSKLFFGQTIISFGKLQEAKSIVLDRSLDDFDSLFRRGFQYFQAGQLNVTLKLKKTKKIDPARIFDKATCPFQTSNLFRDN
jgi:hypothetical protein